MPDFIITQFTSGHGKFRASFSKVQSKSYILLIREAKTLNPFLRKLRGRRSVKFGTVIDYIEECRMHIFFKIMPKKYIKSI